MVVLDTAATSVVAAGCVIFDYNCGRVLTLWGTSCETSWKDLGNRLRKCRISAGVRIGHRFGSGNLEQYTAVRPRPIASFVNPHADTRRLLNPPHANISGMDCTMLSIITTLSTRGRCVVNDARINASWYDFGPLWSLMPMTWVAFLTPVMRMAPDLSRKSASCRLHKFSVAPVSHSAKVDIAPHSV
jgi:hypothetical protein